MSTEDDERRHRYAAWGVTWLAYATYYLGRKGFSVAKKPLEADLGIGRAALGWIDTAYLVAYAVGQLGSGLLADRVGARRLVATGLVTSAVACAAFGSSSTFLVFAVLLFVNGLAQSTGWPGTTRAMAEWTTKETRGRVMALWATCYQVGGLVATAIAGYLVVRYTWRGAFFGVVPALVLVAVLVFVLLRPGPGAPDLVRKEAQPEDAARALAMRTALRSPTLYLYGSSYFAIKLVRYSLLFWLPYYLNDALGYRADTAAYVSTAFEVGGIAGVVLLGTLSDRVRHVPRSAIAIPSLLALAAALAWLPHAGTSVVANVATLAAIGAFLFGPDALVSGAASQDAGGPHAAATATGLVNAIGSTGAVLQGYITVELSRTLGWAAVYRVFAGAAVVAAIALLPTARRVSARPLP